MNTKTSTKLINEATPALEDVLGILIASVPEGSEHTLSVKLNPNTGELDWTCSFLFAEEDSKAMLFDGTGESPWMAMFHALSAFRK